MSWVTKLVFRMWKGINESNKFIQLFQVDVIRGAQSDSKQQFRMNLAMKLIDMSSCVFVYVNTSIWRSIHTDVIRHTLAFQYARLNWAMMLIFFIWVAWTETKTNTDFEWLNSLVLDAGLQWGLISKKKEHPLPPYNCRWDFENASREGLQVFCL